MSIDAISIGTSALCVDRILAEEEQKRLAAMTPEQLKAEKNEKYLKALDDGVEAVADVSPPAEEEETVKKEEKKEEKAKKKEEPVCVFSDEYLCETVLRDIPDIEYWWNGYIPKVGLTLLTAREKTGKGWLCLDFLLQMARGRLFMGENTETAPVAYFALEDDDQVSKSRTLKLLNGEPVPKSISLLNKSKNNKPPRIGAGFEEQLEMYIQTRPEIKLVVLDTYRAIKGLAKGREREDHEAQEGQALSSLATKLDISIVLIHHNNKRLAKDCGSPLDLISGTTGLPSAAEAIIILNVTEETDTHKVADMYVTGRKVTFAKNKVIEWNAHTCKWSLLGSPAEVEKRKAEDGYYSNDLAKTIKALVDESPNKVWSGFSKTILEEGKMRYHSELATSPQQLAKDIKNIEWLLFKKDKIIYQSLPNGNSGVKHKFMKQEDAVGDVDSIYDESTRPF